MKIQIISEADASKGASRFNFFPIDSFSKNTGIPLSGVLEVFADIGTVIKGELKRTLSSVGLLINTTFSFPLKSADEYKQMFADHNKKIEKINAEVNGALSRLETPGANAFMFCLNPGLVMGLAAREQMSTITPEKIDQFWDDYGLASVPILGSVSRGVVKAGVGAGQFATMSAPNYEFNVTSGPDGQATQTSSVQDAETTLIDRLTGIFLFRNPFRNIGEGVVVEKRKMGDKNDPVVAAAQSFLDSFTTVMKNKKGKFEADDSDEELLLDEQDEEKKDEKKSGAEEDEFEKFVQLANMASKEIMDKQGKELVAAHKELLTQLLPDLGAQVQTAIAITKAGTFEEFAEAIESSESKEMKSVDINGLASELEETAITIAKDRKSLTEILEAAGKKLEDFGEEPLPEQQEEKEDAAIPDYTGNTELLSFIVESVYQKEMASERTKAYEGLEQTFNEAYDAILGDLTGEEQLAQVKQTPIGKEFADVCEKGLDELKNIFNDFLETQGG